MSRSLLLTIGLVVVLAAPASADEKASARQAAEKAKEALQASLADESASRADRYEAYQDFKAELGDLEKEDKKAVEAAYAESGLQKNTADALRRSTLPAMGWLMGFFGASLLWGGFMVCVAIAMRSGKKVDPDAE